MLFYILAFLMNEWFLINQFCWIPNSCLCLPLSFRVPDTLTPWPLSVLNDVTLYSNLLFWKRWFTEVDKSGTEKYNIYWRWHWNRNGPECGTFQIAGNDALIDTVTNIGHGAIDIRQTTHAEQLTQVQNNIPVLAFFITNIHTELPDYMKSLIFDILVCMRVPFGGPVRVPGPATSTTNEMSFFPSLPMCRETGFYEADLTRDKPTNDQCRKESWAIIPFHLGF